VVGEHPRRGAQRVARRLQLMSGSAGPLRRAHLDPQAAPLQPHDLATACCTASRLAHRIDRLLVQSGMKWTVEQFLAVVRACLAAGRRLMVAHWPLPLRAGVALPVCAGVAVMLVRRARARRLVRIEQQLPEAADFIARALRAGHSFTNVLQIVGNELPEPLSGEFRIAREEINYGVPMSEALHNMAARIPLTDLRYLIIAVLIQRETGGNLAEILGNISHIIRGRLKLAAQVRVLSAEGGCRPGSWGCCRSWWRHDGAAESRVHQDAVDRSDRPQAALVRAGDDRRRRALAAQG
jgi:tight adherence protein B